MRHEIGSAAAFPQNPLVKKERLWLPTMVVAAGTLIFAGLLAGLPTHALIAASTLLSVFVLGIPSSLSCAASSGRRRP